MSPIVEGYTLMATIAVAGFHHETNTFAPSKATYEDFERGGGWPPLTRGVRAVDVVKMILFNPTFAFSTK